ncbi:MAG: carboxylating nicotinate-nucleotide diphosphorylase [Bryobacterales bacterium]|jgi:nicotinate-nucleotide pyrophosphorylase (carboxylating)|nr:carboxylating nicotinate-nucleotide diphosphorylase [Bryobacterales bacterium]
MSNNLAFDIHSPEIEQLVRMALEEDIGSGDVTSGATVAEGRQASGVFRTKQGLTLAGIELLPLIYRLHGGSIRLLEIQFASGVTLLPGTVVARVAGDARTLLECERVSLNFLQRLSGIATQTAAYVSRTEGTGCRILDTRKTTPGWRKLEKMAVRAGGGVNHRQGLFDAILIKNNHITAAGSITAAIRAAQATGMDFEVEVRTWGEMDEALEAGATKLLLDNLTPEEARDWIRHINGRASTELSGNITLGSVSEYARTGADFISAGALTHSVKAVDLHFLLTLE